MMSNHLSNRITSSEWSFPQGTPSPPLWDKCIVGNAPHAAATWQSVSPSGDLFCGQFIAEYKIHKKTQFVDEIVGLRSPDTEVRRATNTLMAEKHPQPALKPQPPIGRQHVANTGSN